MKPELYRSSSIYGVHVKKNKKKKKNILDKKIPLFGRQIARGILLGVFLTIITFALQCTAFFTPHWKEISPNTQSLYVDNIDALIRTEVLVYFNSVHRLTRHSYGLFQRCEYLISNSSKFLQDQNEILTLILNKQSKTCTKNFLPSFEDDQFDECHSLQYYRFCSKTNGKHFDINNDYLRATYDILLEPRVNLESSISCRCHYPTYVKACHVLGIFALVFLFLTALLFGIYPFLTTRNQQLKVKCFAVLASILATLFILINLLVILNHLEYEAIDYLFAIERHYRENQIYKLSQDTKAAIERFLSSINIKTGYSTLIAWLAFSLSIIDGFLLMLTCKITHDEVLINPDLHFEGLSSDSSQQNIQIENEEHQPSTTLLTSTQNLPKDKMNTSDQQGKIRSYLPPSCIKHSPPSPPRGVHFEASVV